MTNRERARMIHVHTMNRESSELDYRRLWDDIEAALEVVVSEEREACAALAYQLSFENLSLANAIRARLLLHIAV